MAETKKEEELSAKETKTAPVVVANEAMVVDSKGETKPLEEVLGSVKASSKERVVLNVDGKPIVRPATAAELGEDVSKEDSLKFIPPTAPSNAPQPKTYVDGVRVEEGKK